MKINQDVCPVCESSALDLAWPVKSNADGIISDYDIRYCRQCHVGLTNPVPTSMELSKYYSTGVYQRTGGRANRLIDIILSRLYDQRFREIARFHIPPSRLLDIGCGKGRFVARAVELGWDAQGTDTVPGQVDAARARYNIQISLGEIWEIGFKDAFFDVVTAWHVLEHLPDPHPVIAEVRRILRPGGLFVCEVPNLASWQAKIGRGHWFHLDVPRHLVHYTPTAIKYLLNQHGLHVVSMHTFSAELGFFGMLQTLLNLTGIPPNLLFQWLKRSIRPSKKMLIINTAATLIALVPSLLTEILASVARRGGVIRVMATCKCE